MFTNVFAIRALLRGLSEPEGEGTWWFGLLVLVPVTALCQLDQSLSQHHLWNYAQINAMNVRSGVTTLVYRKCLRLRQSDITGANSEVVNLISTDTEKLVQAMSFFHWLWASILEIIICIALSSSAIGWSALGGLVIMVVMIPVQSKLGKRIGVLRRQTVKHTDRRVRTMNEILDGMRIIKLFGWEAEFVDRVNGIRADEIEQLLAAAAIKSANTALAFCLPILVSLVSFWLYQAAGNTLDVPVVFYCLALFNVMYRALNMIPTCVETLSAGMVAPGRRPWGHSDAASYYFMRDSQ